MKRLSGKATVQPAEFGWHCSACNVIFLKNPPPGSPEVHQAHTLVYFCNCSKQLQRVGVQMFEPMLLEQAQEAAKRMKANKGQEPGDVSGQAEIGPEQGRG